MDRSKLAERKAPDGFAKFKSYPVGMQVSYCVDSEMSEEGTVYFDCMTSVRISTRCKNVLYDQSQ